MTVLYLRSSIINQLRTTRKKHWIILNHLKNLLINCWHFTGYHKKVLKRGPGRSFKRGWVDFITTNLIVIHLNGSKLNIIYLQPNFFKCQLVMMLLKNVLAIPHKIKLWQFLTIFRYTCKHLNCLSLFVLIITGSYKSASIAP